MCPEVRVYTSPEDLAKGAAEEFVRSAQAAIAVRGRFFTALSGGQTPRRTFEHLSHRSSEVSWERVHLFWADERPVLYSDPQSNFRLAKELLLPRLAIPESNVHPWRTELPVEEAARDYENTLARVFGVSGTELPAFDLVLLGVGSDGHTASLFPATGALDETKRWAVALRVPQLDAWRLTLTLPVLNNAREAVFLVEGREKAEIVRRVLERQGDLPAARIGAHRTVWILDRAAAGRC